MNEREELLRRWATVALARGEQEKWLPGVCLLDLLIKVIRARGWHYTIESRPFGDTHRLNEGVQVAFVRTGYPPTSGRAEAAEPCDALLSAYVQTIEAEEQAK